MRKTWDTCQFVEEEGACRLNLPGDLYIETNVHGHHMLSDEHSFSSLVEINDAAMAEFKAMIAAYSACIRLGVMDPDGGTKLLDDFWRPAIPEWSVVITREPTTATLERMVNATAGDVDMRIARQMYEALTKGGALTVAARAACSRMGIMDPDGGRTLPDDLLRPATAPSDPECYLSKVEALISEYLGKPDISRETQSLLEDLFIDVEKLGNSLP